MKEKSVITRKYEVQLKRKSEKEKKKWSRLLRPPQGRKSGGGTAPNPPKKSKGKEKGEMKMRGGSQRGEIKGKGTKM